MVGASVGGSVSGQEGQLSNMSFITSYNHSIHEQTSKNSGSVVLRVLVVCCETMSALAARFDLCIFST
jgi:hypothetical protein